MKSRPRRAKRAAPAVRKLPAKGRRPSEANRRVLVSGKPAAAFGNVTPLPLAERIVDRIRSTEIADTTPLQASSLLRSLQREIRQEEIERGPEDQRLREAGWIPVAEQLPPLGEVIQDAKAEGGAPVTVPLMDRFPPDDPTTVRRESEVVLALVDEGVDDIRERGPRLYQYVEYAHGRKVWDDWGGCAPCEGMPPPTHWCRIPGGVGALGRSTVASPPEAASASLRVGPRAVSGAWISVTEQLPPLGEVMQNDAEDPSEGTRRESEVVAVLVPAPRFDDALQEVVANRMVAEPRLALYIWLYDGEGRLKDRGWESYGGDGALHPTHWLRLPRGPGMMVHTQRLG